MKPVPPPLSLTPKDEDILRAVYTFRYMTARDVAYLAFSPRILNYVRHRLARLSGGMDLAPHPYLCRFQLPGTGEKIFTLGAKGRDFLQREAGLPVDWYFRPYRLPHFSFSHLLHALLLTRFVVAGQYWSRTQHENSLSQQRLSYELSRVAGLNVIPDAWLLFERADGAQFPIWLEIDRGTQHKAPFQKRLHERLDFVRSGQYESIFNIPAVIMAYATTGQLPTYGETRRQALCTWTMEVLTELQMQQWAGIFRLTSLTYADIYTTSLFDAPVWYRPDATQAAPLLSPSG
jgi:hypothetical protein